MKINKIKLKSKKFSLIRSARVCRQLPLLLQSHRKHAFTHLTDRRALAMKGIYEDNRRARNKKPIKRVSIVRQTNFELIAREWEMKGTQGTLKSRLLLSF
jgi:hypothetical protein